jgi:ADP-ribose pyrophosphatase YjhB (NUDIX family)
MRDAFIRGGYRCVYWAARAYWFIMRPQTSGAVVALWNSGRVLLVRSSYRPQYGFPGGFLRRGEAPAAGASREVHEELGLVIPASQLELAWQGIKAFENRRDSISIFEASIDPPFPLTANKRELVWVGWTTPADALALRLLPHVRDYLMTARPQGVSR